tara:strand:+ start:283 stop:810 length:528 start_codon:yes stop_codon:yes gene_type:complete
MNKSKSYPQLSEDVVQPMRKSKSLSELSDGEQFFEEFFEGDGVLGIVFIKFKDSIVVESIVVGTVASETYGLDTRMELLEVNNEAIVDLSFGRVMKRINESWVNRSCVFLKFKKEFYPEVSKLLYKNNLSQFYDNFVELGAKYITDFEYIEMGDLIEMGMIKKEILLFKNINPNI